MGQNHADRPSRRQLAYLRALADRTGQTFAYPQTRRQASLEIQRLERTEPDTPIAHAIETKQTRAAVQQLADSSAVRPDEISGYGSNCRWSHWMRAGLVAVSGNAGSAWAHPLSG